MAESRSAPVIKGRRVLVVEDEFLIAEDIRQQLENLGARVLGPVPRVRAALRLIDSGQSVDGATLDVTLGSERSFPIADALRARGVPFVFVTGQDEWALPEVYRDVPRYRKPADLRGIAEALFA